MSRRKADSQVIESDSLIGCQRHVCSKAASGQFECESPHFLVPTLKP